MYLFDLWMKNFLLSFLGKMCGKWEVNLCVILRTIGVYTSECGNNCWKVICYVLKEGVELVW